MTGDRTKETGAESKKADAPQSSSNERSSLDRDGVGSAAADSLDRGTSLPDRSGSQPGGSGSGSGGGKAEVRELPRFDHKESAEEQATREKRAAEAEAENERQRAMLKSAVR